MVENYYLGASEVAQQIRDRQHSPETLARSLLSRIDSLDGTLKGEGIGIR